MEHAHAHAPNSGEQSLRSRVMSAPFKKHILEELSADGGYLSL